MLISKDSPAGAASPFAPILAAASRVILGKDHELRLAAACLLAGGHLLIEDLPGLGKTTLAHTLARLLGLQFSRVQFTADLLPADVTGVSIFERRHEPGASEFRFLPGPIFTQVLHTRLAALLPEGAQLPRALGAEAVHHLPAALQQDYLQAFGGAIHSVYQIAAGVMALAFALTWLLKDVPLRHK